MKLFLTLAILICGVSQNASAIQIIHSSPRNASDEQRYRTHQMNMQEEQQELYRKQVRMQEEMLRLQQQQQRHNYYGR